MSLKRDFSLYILVFYISIVLFAQSILLIHLNNKYDFLSLTFTSIFLLGFTIWQYDKNINKIPLFHKKEYRPERKNAMQPTSKSPKVAADS